MEEFGKAFFHDGYKLGLKAIKAANISAALSEMYESIDELIEKLFELASKQNQNITCRKGCEWCCHQPVFALDYELDYLSNYISVHLNETQQHEIKTRARKKQHQLSSLEGDDLLNAKHACPLLQNGACIAYSARPMACRIYLSSNLSSCMKFFHEPKDPHSYPALLDFPMRAGRMMNEGFKAALKTEGITAKEFRIEEKL